MNPSAAIPRVNGGFLPSFLGRRVRIVGKITDPNQGLLEASDGVVVKIHHQMGQTPTTPFVEVIGIVQSDGSIQEETTVSFGETFHLENYNNMLLLSTRFPAPFSES